MSKKYFGTDGIRGRVGESLLTPEFVLKLGWAAGKVLGGHGDRRILIGKDTRISGYMFESALEAGLSAAGVNSELLGPMPTPAIAYLTQTLRASGGIVISASHNPYYDNGIKFLSAQGAKLPDEQEVAIEKLLEQDMDCVESSSLGKASRVTDARGRYIEFCKSKFPPELHLNGLKIVVDCAHGAAYHIAPKVFAELGAEVIAVGSRPNGVNINLDCGATHPEMLAQAVLDNEADVGVALDGDGDRVMMVDHRGEIIDGDQILYILAEQMLKAGYSNSGVVGTVMSNMGLELALGQMGVAFRRANVGDRYVMQLMQQEKWILGGETSGHIICLDKAPTGDGIISALQVLNCLVSRDTDLYTLKQGMEKFPQILVNIPVIKGSRVYEHESVKRAVLAAEKRLHGRGRVLLRPSGTEPVLRIMVEGDDVTVVQEIAGGIAAVAEAAGSTAA
ncbi:MAG TPA: phosphoglucosamine mutase [Gammaproteobacteria bacterium]